LNFKIGCNKKKDMRMKNKMIMQPQAGIFKAMQNPDFYPHAVSAIEQRDTHISKVFLTGDFAYKVKKPVDLEFLDFTTLDKRLHFCRQELILNRRLAPQVYLDVLPITLKDGRYYLNGPGKAVEYAVKMRQLPESYSLLRLVRRGKLSGDSLNDLARILAEFYDKALTSRETTAIGSWETVRTNVEENFRQTGEFVGKFIDERLYLIIRAAAQAFLRRRKPLFQRRMDRKKIRDCHGDLRAGHIYFYEGIQIIDCIEFNDRFRYADITSDLAFLAMDLDFEGYPQIAGRLISSFLKFTKDEEMLVLLDFYKSYRAFVRVKVNCLRLQENDLSPGEKSKLRRETQQYLELTYQYAVQFTRPTIWVICGLPASGKSTIAETMSETLGVKVLRSDLVRKEMFGLDPTEARDLPFEEGIYSKEATSLTYGRLLMTAQQEVKKGCSVILDATFGSQHQRDEVIRLAQDMDTNILFVECTSSNETIRKRLVERETTGGISDARLHHLKQLKVHFEPLDQMQDDLHLKVDTEVSVDRSMRRILSHDYTLLARQTARAMKILSPDFNESVVGRR
jgi:aminoglycoside phosphotransferase family enzyme/predicted kinase